jgi:4-hydroxy-tetrahydrodipicolinate reductase
MSIRVAVYGLGPIGLLIAKEVLEKRDIELVAAFDIDPLKVGKDLGQILGLEHNLGLMVSNGAEAMTVLQEKGVNIVLHSTSTYFEKIYPQIVNCIKAGVDIISTSETLSNPWYRYPELATLVDEMAQKNCVSVLGTGINPGFIFDSLPIIMTSVCTEISKIHVVRSQDASKRRISFQKKYGLSLGVEEFKEKMEKNEITAHVGYGESVSLIALALGVKLTKIVEGQDALIAKRPLKTQYFEIPMGKVSGIKGYGLGYLGEKEFIRVELIAEAGGEEFEEINIEGTPSVRWRSSGIAGDTATAAMVINMIPKVINARPGLLRMLDISLPSAFINLGKIES